MPSGFFRRVLLKGALDLIFPRRCLLCGAFLSSLEESPGRGAGRDICPECLKEFIPLKPAYCLRCGRPFKTRIASVHTCAHCLKKPPVYDRARSAGLYRDALRKAVHGFKYNGRTEMSRPLAAFMSENLEPPFYPAEADLILPVPLHRRRVRQRGFNQSLLLAGRLFAFQRGLIRHDLLLRSRWTEPQVSLKGRERLENVRRAFALADPGALRGRRVLIVDDVYTTGATANECARVLKQAGASQVLVLTLARVC